MKNSKELTKALNKFKKQYPMVTIGDLQTFIIAWNEAVKVFEPIFYKKGHTDGWIAANGMKD